MSSYFVTGAGRGLGLELVKQLCQLPKSEVGAVFASTRSAPSFALKNLMSSSDGRVHNIQLQITDQKSIDAAVKEVSNVLGDKGLSVLINNAGVMPILPEGIPAMTDLMEVMSTNVLSVQMIISSFLPLLRKGNEKKVVQISSSMGSIAMGRAHFQAPTPAYKISKAALNMLTVQYALQLEDEGFTFVSVSPGWLKTDLGSEHADLPVEVGAKATLKIIMEADQSLNGKFRDIGVPGFEDKPGPNHYLGGDLPW